MSDSFNKIFVWQLGVAVVIGLAWALIWEIDKDELGFFFDLPWGFFLGFVYGVVAVVVVGLIALGVWAVVRLIQGAEGGLGSALTEDVDRLGGSEAVTGVNRTLDTWNTSGVAWGIAWGFGVAFLWGVAGGLVWGFELNFVLRIVVALLFGAGGALALTGLYDVNEPLAETLGGGYSWMEGAVSSISERWLSSGLPPLNWGIAGLLAVGGTGAGIVQAIVIAIVTLIAALAGGFVGAQLKRSM
jgi:hypothetical protein